MIVYSYSEIYSVLHVCMHRPVAVWAGHELVEYEQSVASLSRLPADGDGASVVHRP